MAHDAFALPLLEFMQHRAGCLCLSDLQSIADWLRSRPVREWNGALAYLSGAPPEETAQAARERLIHVLSRP